MHYAVIAVDLNWDSGPAELVRVQLGLVAERIEAGGDHGGGRQSGQVGSPQRGRERVLTRLRRRQVHAPVPAHRRRVEEVRVVALSHRRGVGPVVGVWIYQELVREGRAAPVAG